MERSYIPIEITPAVAQRCRRLERLFGGAAIGQTFGITLRYGEDGLPVFAMADNPRLRHGMGDTHGGAIATLLDNAGWFAVALHYETWIATVELQTRLLEPCRNEDLVATGWPVRVGKRIGVAEMEVRTSTGRLVATGAGTFTVTGLTL